MPRPSAVPLRSSSPRSVRGMCAHSPCQVGVALNPTCDPCVDLICLLDPFCCTTTWDTLCVSNGQLYCGCI